MATTEIGKRIKELRNDRGLTLELVVYDMGQQFNIELNKGLLSKWENGVNEPSLYYASLLAQYFDVSLDFLIGLTDDRRPARLRKVTKKREELK